MTVKRKKSKVQNSHSKKSKLTQDEKEALKEDLKREETEYRAALRKADRESYRNYCSNLTQSRKIAKMPKDKSQPWEELNVLIKENGEFTEDSIETLEILAEAHYPQPPDNQVEDPIALDTDITGEHKDMIDSIFSKDRMDRIIKKLPSNK